MERFSLSVVGAPADTKGASADMARFGEGLARFGGALALVATLLVSAAPADARVRQRRAAASAAPLSFGAFTPAAADPRLAAAFARDGLGTGNVDSAFRFTPSGGGGSRRAITVAVRSRLVSRQQAAHALALPSDGLAPSAYSLGASVSWRHFALSGDVSKIDPGLLPDGRESADVGLSFVGKKFATKFDLGAERSSGERPQLVGIDQSWSVGLGGSYSLTRNLNLNGGVRYKLQHDELLSLSDGRRDSQSVYLGTTFKF
jgi:hypothetical protein